MIINAPTATAAHHRLRNPPWSFAQIPRCTLILINRSFPLSLSISSSYSLLSFLLSARCYPSITVSLTIDTLTARSFYLVLIQVLFFSSSDAPPRFFSRLRFSLLVRIFLLASFLVLVLTLVLAVVTVAPAVVFVLVFVVVVVTVVVVDVQAFDLTAMLPIEEREERRRWYEERREGESLFSFPSDKCATGGASRRQRTNDTAPLYGRRSTANTRYNAAKLRFTSLSL